MALKSVSAQEGKERSENDRLALDGVEGRVRKYDPRKSAVMETRSDSSKRIAGFFRRLKGAAVSARICNQEWGGDFRATSASKVKLSYEY